MLQQTQWDVCARNGAEGFGGSLGCESMAPKVTKCNKWNDIALRMLEHPRESKSSATDWNKHPIVSVAAFNYEFFEGS